jgi:coproporphyrinogen III oxidase
MSTLDVATGRAFFMGLQQRIMAEVVRLDGAQPISDAWHKAPGEMLQGDGLTMIVEDGSVFERAGCGFSHVQGPCT